MNLVQCEEKTDIDSDLKQLFYQCSDYSKKCHLCPYTNQRTDGFACSLVDIIQSKMGGIDNGKSKD